MTTTPVAYLYRQSCRSCGRPYIVTDPTAPHLCRRCQVDGRTVQAVERQEERGCRLNWLLAELGAGQPIPLSA